MRTTKHVTITGAQLKVLNVIDEYSAAAMVKALRLVHDATLYHSHIVIDEPTRQELFYIKELIDAIEDIAKEKPAGE